MGGSPVWALYRPAGGNLQDALIEKNAAPKPVKNADLGRRVFNGTKTPDQMTVNVLTGDHAEVEPLSF